MTEPSEESIQGRIEREEFARGHLPEGAAPATPRLAATTVIARPGSSGLFELLLLKRPLASRFAAGAYVFPGGVVDDADGSEFWRSRMHRPSNLPPDGLPAATAGIRELFEETGILLADQELKRLDALEVLRHKLLAEEVTFEDVVRDRSLTFLHAPLTYFARWVTPRRLARRYDALFFLVALSSRSEDVTITEEHDGLTWVTPRAALAEFTAGRLPMLFPTWKTVQQLSAFDHLDEAVRVLGTSSVTSIEPFLDVDGNTVRPRMPERS
ncbi:MAG: NUDIX hydrolase [Gemmatimonadota bacterium]|nr:NUDIX hydrolase [Gemmatimonadota bacterium]